ncbi:MAG: hypothetical protein WBD31_06685 [Rubripirellula sp.]
MIVYDSDRLSERRVKLSNLSWWMRRAAENAAPCNNAEDGVTGHFWEGGYKAVVLLHEALLLARSAYVDLNPTVASTMNRGQVCVATSASAAKDAEIGGRHTESIDDATTFDITLPKVPCLIKSDSDRSPSHVWNTMLIPLLHIPWHSR